MKKGANTYTTRAFIWSIAAASVFAGCSKKEKKHDDAPSKQEVETSLVEVSNTDGQAKFRYTSNIQGAKFKCMIEYDGQASDWQDCSSDGISFPVPDGVSFVFRVKAIAPDGTEDIQPYEYKSPTAGNTSSQQLQLYTEILGKEELSGNTLAKDNLRLEFATRGADVNPADIRYECRRENEQDFRACPTGNIYNFASMTEGTPYSLTVRGIHDATQSIAAEDTIQFSVQLPKLVINGEDQLRQNKTGVVDLQFNPPQANQSVYCSVDGTQEFECTQGYQVNLNNMTKGSHDLSVKTRDTAGVDVISYKVNFCAQQCSAATGAAAPMTQVFQIGSFYEYLVPEEMHVTEYATTKTYNDQLSFYRVMADSDPYYLGNYGCYRDFDRVISAAAPNGTVYDYCHTTPQRDAYKWLTDFRLANNHIEVATNATYVDYYHHDRIMINVFDQDYEFMHDRSRFEQLCLNKRGTITKTPPIRFVNRNFWGESVKAEFYMCVAELASSGPGLPQAGDEWWIGAFFITNEGLNLPKYECFRNDWKQVYQNCDGSCVERIGYDPQWCGDFRNPNLLEVLFMTKTPYREAADFARAAQQQFLNNLQEVSPLY